MPKEMLAERRWVTAGGRTLELGRRSRIVGILNVTPDSFSDGGRFTGTDAAVAQGLRLLDQGASLVDVGGESTRPGYEPVSEEEERARVVPVVEGLVQAKPDAHVSVDTSKASVGYAALAAGACWINDVWGFQRDPALARAAAEYEAGAILMRNGRDGEKAGSVLDRIRRSWERSVAVARAAGVAEERIVLDPGLGFGTTRQEDLDILRGLPELRRFGFPLLLGASRKRITSLPLGLGLGERLETTLATTGVGIAAGVEFFRAHDVAAHFRYASLADLIASGEALDE